MHKEINNFSVDCVTCTTRHQSVFCNLKMADLAHFDSYKTCVVYKKGQTIFHENSYPLGIYCVNTGKMKVVRSGNDGKEQIVRLVKDGDLLGYRALFSNTKYNASAITLEDSSVCFIPRDTFFDVLRSSSGLALDLIKMLACELGKAEQNITDLAQKTVKARIAEALLLLKDTYGLEKDGATINICLSREDIASLVGTATETIIRLLSVYKQEKILELKGKKIKILDMQQLVKEADGHPVAYKAHVFS